MKDILLANKNKIAAILIVLILGFFWHSYQKSSNSTGTLPIIYAPTSEYKIKPEDAGGYQVQNEDVTIYNALRGEEDWEDFDPSQVTQKEENLDFDFEDNPEAINDRESDVVGSPAIVDEEAPVEEPEIENLFDIVSSPDNEEEDDYLSRIKKGVELSEKTSPSPSAIIKETQDEDAAKTAQEKDIDDVINTIATPPAKKPIAKAEVTTKKAETPAPSQDINETIIDASNPALTHFVQLGSFRTETAALTALQQFQSKYKPVLDATPTTFEKANIPDKGEFIRVKAGPLTKSDADTLCAKIKDKKGSCYVTAK